MIDPSTRMLVVAEMPTTRKMIDTMLQASGIKVVRTAPDGISARELIINKAVDFILCDCTATDTSGMDFLREVRSLDVTKYLPFMFMSGVGQLDDKDIAAGKDLDVNGYVVKPISQKDMEDRISAAMKAHTSLVDSLTHLSRAAAFVDVGEFEEARTELKSALAKGSASPRVWNDTGDLYEDMDHHREAKMCYEKSIQIDEYYAKPYSGMGNVLAKEDDNGLALEYLNKAADISPRSSERQYNLAKFLLKNGDKNAARIAVERAVKGSRRDEASAELRTKESAAAAEFYLAAGHADMAEEQFTLALEGDPDNTHYYNRLGMAFRRQKKFPEAVKNYLIALKVDPGDIVIHYNMALALASMGNYSSAASSLRKALTIDSSFSDAEILLKKINNKL